jgi:hypothetical protein
MFVAALYHEMNFVETHFHTKLSIQSIVHCSVVSEWIHCSRRKFNFTVSVETLVYQNCDTRDYLLKPYRLVGIVRLLIGLGPFND